MDSIQLENIRLMQPRRWEETSKSLLKDFDSCHQKTSSGTHSGTNSTADLTRSTSRRNASLLIKANIRPENSRICMELCRRCKLRGLECIMSRKSSQIIQRSLLVKLESMIGIVAGIIYRWCVGNWE
jgi:hypothetical protein